MNPVVKTRRSEVKAPISPSNEICVFLGLEGGGGEEGGEEGEEDEEEEEEEEELILPWKSAWFTCWH